MREASLILRYAIFALGVAAGTWDYYFGPVATCTRSLRSVPPVAVFDRAAVLFAGFFTRASPRGGQA